MATDQNRLFLITGATGKTGTTTVTLLLERGYRVRAFVHRPDSRSAPLAAAAAEIVAGDLLNLNDVSSAMRGVSGTYFAYPIAPGLPDATVVLAQAAAEAGVRSVVNMSQVSARREASSNAAQAVPGGARLIDSLGLENDAEASSQAQVLDALRGAHTNADRFYLSPPASYGAQVPGQRTGSYRTGDDVLLTNSAGKSEISADDFAIAFLDEIERPVHHKARFTVAY